MFEKLEASITSESKLGCKDQESILKIQWHFSIHGNQLLFEQKPVFMKNFQLDCSKEQEKGYSLYIT